MSVLIGLRLALAGGREAVARLALTTAGVAVGVTLLLLSLTGQSALHGRAERSGWQHTDEDPAATAADPLLFLTVTDYHNSVPIARMYVAALGPGAPVPPGLDRLPAPGEVAVSPAMRRLLESTPDDQLDDRFPGRVTATIGDAGLEHRDQLVALIGLTPQQAIEIGAHRTRGFDALTSGYAFTAAYRIFLGLLAIVLLAPVVVFVVMVTRIGAARREQRLAAIRLVGGSRLQVAIVASAETAVAAIAGTALGWVGYQTGRQVVASTVRYQGAYLFADDVVVPTNLLLAVLAGVPMLAILATIVSLHRVQVRPLGTSRRARRPRPGAWRAVPLAIGLGGLLVAGPFRGELMGRETALELSTLFLPATIVGLVLAGPLVCVFVARALARITRRTPGLIAARRIANDPRAMFRAVSGVVLACFAATFFSGVVSNVDARPNPNAVGALRPGVVEVYVGGASKAEVAPLLTDQAVFTQIDVGNDNATVITCADLARALIVSCPHSARFGNVSGDGVLGLAGDRVDPTPETANLPVMSVYLITDGSPAAQNRSRTKAANLVPRAIINTQADKGVFERSLTEGVVTLVRLGALFIVLVAACSLTVAAVGGLIERRRPFALLRASGVRLGELRRVVLLETGIPLVATTLLGVGVGLIASYAFMVIEDDRWYPPTLGLVAVIGGGLVAALAITTLTLPLLSAATRHDAIRYE